MGSTSTIWIRSETKAKLDTFRNVPDESYNSIIERLMTMATDHEPLSREEVKGIEESLKEYAEGNFYTAEEAWGDNDKECTQ